MASEDSTFFSFYFEIRFLKVPDLTKFITGPTKSTARVARFGVSSEPHLLPRYNQARLRFAEKPIYKNRSTAFREVSPIFGSKETIGLPFWSSDLSPIENLWGIDDSPLQKLEKDCFALQESVMHQLVISE
ncbi:unnamed protein product [Ceratitis capitata]|uniref:(Mediterranean fruit fly) hypothetical protein n=1 Tax=Ceratitis capitata TaxID=7213 RepID=A0A811V1U5_CERCA|nr:unnamed protein product [Ceratitis capitata]